MKNGQSKSNQKSIQPDPYGRNTMVKIKGDKDFLPKADKTHMAEKLVVPPARVWEKIEKILDEQEERRKIADELISSSFKKEPNATRRTFYLVAVAGASLIAGILWHRF